ncbi:MAG: SpoIIE family protein phosphatase [Deltaproteobacteria bacterium]|jgi:sigma-B regulation protein RsbU (phosphoserine phosphatase)|nr:SpoIIE family protein phosphatase [Deltaproteobacteria bacterium]
MRVSLSAKLTLLLLGGLCCVLIPVLAVTYAYTGENALQADKARFMTTLRVVEENVNAGFLRLNESKLEEAMRAKEVLRNTARHFAILLPPGGIQTYTSSRSDHARPYGSLNDHASTGSDLLTLRRKFIQESAKNGVLLGSFQIAELAREPQTRMKLSPDMTGLAGNTLRDLLAELSASGNFAIYHLPEHDSMLFYFLPVPEQGTQLPEAQAFNTRHEARNPAGGKWDRVIVCASSIKNLEAEAEATVQLLINALKERVNILSLYPKGFLAVLDYSGASLAVNGDFGPSELTSLTPLLDQARKFDATVQEDTLVITRADGTVEEYLVAVQFSRPFRWFTVMAAPVAEISAASNSLLKQLTMIGLYIGLITLFVSMYMLRSAIKPLRLLLPKLTALPDLDFSSPQTGTALVQDLPLKRQDEVGDLARSFAVMGEKLQVNIRALVESSAVQERMRGELGAAREIQHGILPPPGFAPNVSGIASSAMLEPAREVGGDLYYFFTLPDGRYAFAIGDVSGKGVPAALFMAITVTLTRHILATESDPGAALSKINAMLEAHNPQTMFVTLFLALYDPASGRLDYANGGHNPPLLVGGGEAMANGNSAASDNANISGSGERLNTVLGGSGAIVHPVTRLDEISGPMVGVLPGIQYQSFSRILQPGELCLLYTDGVTEAVNEATEAYDDERLEAYLAAHGSEHPKELLDGIFADVRRFRGKAAPFDDITMLAFARR